MDENVLQNGRKREKDKEGFYLKCVIGLIDIAAQSQRQSKSVYMLGSPPQYCVNQLVSQ